MASAEVMTTRYYEEQGYTVEDVRRWNPWSKTRKDFLGFADLHVFGHSRHIAVQATIGLNNLPARIAKIKASPKALDWLQNHDAIEAIAWRKLKQRNKDGTLGKRVKYEPKIVEITLKDFEREREDG